MIRLRYMSPNGDALETGETVKDVGIELQTLQDNQYNLIIRYNTVLRTGRVDFIQPIADEIHIVLQATREDVDTIIDTIRNAISDTLKAINVYQNKKSSVMAMEINPDYVYDKNIERPKEYVDLNQVLSPWL